MYLSTITIENFRCFGEGAKRLELSLSRGLTALVGENDSGKTAVIDALRFVLGTTDQEWYRLEDTDFHGEGATREIKIVCAFEGLSDRDRRVLDLQQNWGRRAGSLRQLVGQGHRRDIQRADCGTSIIK